MAEKIVVQPLAYACMRSKIRDHASHSRPPVSLSLQTCANGGKTTVCASYVVQIRIAPFKSIEIEDPEHAFGLVL